MFFVSLFALKQKMKGIPARLDTTCKVNNVLQVPSLKIKKIGLGKIFEQRTVAVSERKFLRELGIPLLVILGQRRRERRKNRYNRG